MGELMLPEALEKRLASKKGKVVAVGDACAAGLILKGRRPALVIYDGKIMRAPAGKEVADAIAGFEGKELKVPNPAGYISDELVGAVKRALEGKAAKIFVDGEEDLAALVVMMFAPDGALVVYGQPNEGVVLIESREETRNKARRIYNKMLVV